MSQIYEDGTYFDHNPLWHAEDSPWKARQIQKMIQKHSLKPMVICEVGCGVGEILNQLSGQYNQQTRFVGYEVSPQAYELCVQKAKPNVMFKLANLLNEDTEYFDIVLAIDVFEHVDDYLGFLRNLKSKGRYKIFHIPLDLSVQSVLRASPIVRARQTVGHVHHYTKETALDTLKVAGYKVIDYFYTGGSLELPNRGWKANLIKVPRRIAFSLNEDLAVRVLGGYSLLVLAE